MFRLTQKIIKFNISKFEAAAQAIKQSGKQERIRNITEEEKLQLWSLYKQATEGYLDQMPMSSTSNPHPTIQRYWSKYQGRTKQEAQQDYVKLAKNLLQKYGAEKYIKDF